MVRADVVISVDLETEEAQVRLGAVELQSGGETVFDLDPLRIGVAFAPGASHVAPVFPDGGRALAPDGGARIDGVVSRHEEAEGDILGPGRYFEAVNDHVEIIRLENPVAVRNQTVIVKILPRYQCESVEPHRSGEPGLPPPRVRQVGGVHGLRNDAELLSRGDDIRNLADLRDVRAARPIDVHSHFVNAPPAAVLG